MKIPFSKVTCDGNELNYVTDVLKSGWLTTASKALALEQRFVDYTGAKYACAMNSCTAALHLGLEAMGVREGDKVFVPAMTFTATAEVVRYLNADPVFLDVEYGTNLITPAILQDAIKRYPEVRYLIVVHFGGHPAEMVNASQTGIADICKEHGIRVLEDAAHAFPASINGHRIGGIGDVTCFSFYANKTITTGEGGMLTTNDEEIFRRVKIMRLHGINRDVWDRFTSDKPSWEYDVVAPGFKYNMPDLNAAIGLAQMERAEMFRADRQRIAEYYYKELADLPCLELPGCKVPHEDHAWHLFPVVLNRLSPLSRNRVVEMLSERGIGTSVHYKPIYRMSYYRDLIGADERLFPNCEKTWQGTFSLPIYPLLSVDELDYIVNSIWEILV
ncbi:MAG: DegT/DnrJ/EryC1/StrS family aminotransferase [Marinilabiliaceae bacterium]|nr:DegT/DnrJ/EryC1/StrS family aminotransferase [Marinilabiliaceae bacterium]